MILDINNYKLTFSSNIIEEKMNIKAKIINKINNVYNIQKTSSLLVTYKIFALLPSLCAYIINKYTLS